MSKLIAGLAVLGGIAVTSFIAGAIFHKEVLSFKDELEDILKDADEAKDKICPKYKYDDCGNVIKDTSEDTEETFSTTEETATIKETIADVIVDESIGENSIENFVEPSNEINKSENKKSSRNKSK